MNKENKFNLSMLILRTVIGVIFLTHGSQKLFGMFNGIGFEGTVSLVESLGSTKPVLVAVIWGGIEFIGGLFLVMGIMARWAAGAIVLTLFFCLWKINVLYGLFAQNAGIEYDILIIGTLLPVILVGGGSWGVWDA